MSDTEYMDYKEERNFICLHGTCYDTSFVVHDVRSAVWFVPPHTPIKTSLQVNTELLYHMPTFEGRSVLSHLLQIFDLELLGRILVDTAVVPFMNGFNIVRRDVMFLPCDTLDDALAIVNNFFPQIEYPLTYKEEDIVKPNNTWNS